MLLRRVQLKFFSCTLLFLLTILPQVTAQEMSSDAVAQDQALVQAIAKHDGSAAGALLADNLVWTDRTGQTLKKATVVENLASLTSGDGGKPHRYGDVVYFNGIANNSTDKVRF